MASLAVAVIGLASAAAMVMLGVALLWLDFEKRANRAFALVLFCKAGAMTLGFGSMLATAQIQWFFQLIVPYFNLALAPAALYFALVHPRPRSWFGRSLLGPWIFMACTGLILGAYFVNHDLFAVMAPGVSDQGALQLTGPTDSALGAHALAFGPLILLVALQGPALAALAVHFAQEYTRAETDATRFSAFLVAAGFILNGLFDGSRAALGLTGLPGAEFPWLPWGWSMALLPILSLPLAILAFGIMARHRFGDWGQEARLERRLMIAGAAAIGTAVAPQLLGYDSGFLASPLAIFLLGMWRLSLPLLVGYALLRYALFDIDFRLRTALGNGTVAGIFGAVFFIVSESIEGVVSDAQGQWGGLAAAALLTIAIGPLKKLGARVAAKVMPGAVPAAKVKGDKAALYRAQVEMVLEDGNMSQREEKLLDALRQTWGITAKQARRIEVEVKMRSSPSATPSSRVIPA